MVLLAACGLKWIIASDPKLNRPPVVSAPLIRVTLNPGALFYRNGGTAMVRTAILVDGSFYRKHARYL